MYIVYFEPHALYIGHRHHASVGQKIIDTSTGKNSIWQVFTAWAKDETKGDLHVFCSDPDSCFHALAENFTLIEAAGGVVENPFHEILMIFRLGKWDLPKGKLDKGETSHTAAIREVVEECGIHTPSIGKKLPPTHHVYRTHHEGWILKTTQWYSMKISDRQLLTPQVSENITKAEWVKKEQAKTMMGQAYRSIADLINYYLNQHQ